MLFLNISLQQSYVSPHVHFFHPDVKRTVVLLWGIFLLGDVIQKQSAWLLLSTDKLQIVIIVMFPWVLYRIQDWLSRHLCCVTTVL